MEASAMVIKVIYGDFIRRFNASVTDGKLDLSMLKLIEKICILFNFATDTELTLTYIDEDGETVALVDDDDLHDVVEQALNPLRITVSVNEEKNSSPSICSTGSSTPLSSPQVQQFQNINSGVYEILKTIPDPLRETLAKLSTDLVTKLSSSAPGISPGTAEIVEYFSKVGLSCLSQISELQAIVRPISQNDVPERKATVTETKDSDLSKVDPTPLKVKSQGGSKNHLPQNNENSPKLKSVATMVDPDPLKAQSRGATVDPTPLKAKSQGGSKEQLPQNNENSPKIKSVATMVDPIPSKDQSQGGSKEQLPRNIENSPEYDRIDLPALHPQQWPSKLDSCFIHDVTMIDGTIITPLTPFTKIWRMRNNGPVVWPEKSRLVWIGGHKLSNKFSVELQVPAGGLAVNQELDVAVDFVSPQLPGQYFSHWRMAAPSGQKFGQSVWVHIQVHTTTGETQHDVRGLNLNLPPVNNVSTGPKVNNAVMDPLVKDTRSVPNIKQDMKFPISDSSMVGSGATNSAPSSMLNPVIDQPDMVSPVYPPPCAHYPSRPPPVLFPSTSPLLYTLPEPPVFYPPPPYLLYHRPPRVFYPPPPHPVTFPPHLASHYTSPSPPWFYSCPQPAGDTLENTEELQEMEELENNLLRELDEMGFKQVDLNREILRSHNYDMQQTIDDLHESSG